MTEKRLLTEAEWSAVFRSRCKSKQGQRLTEQEQALVEQAFKSDPRRYRDTEVDVFNATVPFGSSARRKRAR